MKKCIVNFEDKEIISVLSDLGYNCIPVINSNKVSQPISAHSDVLYKKIDNNTVLISSCQRANITVFEDSGYNVVFSDNLSPGYKTESLLNFIINEKFIIRNSKTAINLDKKYTADKTIINVKQGYTACSTLQINETAYITEDAGIYKTLTENGIDCLIIEKGDIELNGYDYGFIGGASVKLADNKILFFGDIENINEKNKVIQFIRKYNMEPIFIKNKKLKDIGSALIL